MKCNFNRKSAIFVLREPKDFSWNPRLPRITVWKALLYKYMSLQCKREPKYLN